MIIHPQYPLKDHNTFKVDARAAFFAEITSPDAIGPLFADTRFRDLPCLVLGGGSNTLFTRDFDGLVLQNAIRGIQVIDEDARGVTLEIGGGEPWQALVDYAVAHNLAGVENMTQIPGTVGAAPVQNISAYGQSLDEVLLSLDACELANGETRVFSKAQCQLGYRDSTFKRAGRGRYLITRVRVRLTKVSDATLAGLNTGYQSRYDSLAGELAQFARPPYTLKDISTAVTRIRTRKFPDLRIHGTAGSFFTNPVITLEQLEKIQQRVPGVQSYPAETLASPDAAASGNANSRVKVPAGWLLDALGWKGKRIGSVGTSPNQALVIINYGGATGQEILDFAHLMQEDFERAYGIPLEAEVNII